MRFIDFLARGISSHLYTTGLNRLGRVLCIAVLSIMPAYPVALDPAASLAVRGMEVQIYQEVNRVRGAAGIPPLAWNEALAGEAKRHASNMAQMGFFSHHDPSRGELADRLSAAGIVWSRCAENLYEEKGVSDPARRAVSMWLSSVNHRKNILDATLSECGVGVVSQPDGTIVIVQEFLRK